MPDVTGRGGQGIEVVYSEQVDDGIDIVWSRGRTGYSNGPWSPPVQVNTQDVFSKPNTISWLPPLGTATSSYGYGYIEEGNGYLYFTRSVIPGDINNDGTVDLKDVVQSLQIITGELAVNAILNVAADIDEDGNIGLVEAIYGLQVVCHRLETPFRLVLTNAEYILAVRVQWFAYCRYWLHSYVQTSLRSCSEMP